MNYSAEGGRSIAREFNLNAVKRQGIRPNRVYICDVISEDV